MRADITVILDRSGSMEQTRDDAMNGFTPEQRADAEKEE